MSSYFDESSDYPEWMKEMFANGGTLTGRVKSTEPEMQHILPPTNLREAMGLRRQELEGLHMGLDLSKIEARAMYMLITYVDGKPVYTEILPEDFFIEGGTVGMFQTAKPYLTPDEWHDVEIEITKQLDTVVRHGIRGRKADFAIIDEYAMMEIEPKDKPIKQNGRSASYLQHDRTKQHKLKKPVKRRR